MDVWNRSGARALAVGMLWACAVVGAIAEEGASQSPESLLTAVRMFLEGQFAAVGDDYQIDVAPVDARLKLAACGEPLEVFSVGNRVAPGSQSLGVRCLAPRPWTVYLKANVSLFKSVPVLQRPLRQGAILAAGDVMLVRQDVARLRQGYLSDPAAVVGLAAARDLPQGTVLSARQFVPPKLIRKGQHVAIVSERSSLSVSVAGIALQDGAVGQRVRVRNEQSGRVVEGVVLESGAVSTD